VTVIIGVTLSMNGLNFVIIKLTCCLVIGVIIGGLNLLDFNVICLVLILGLLLWVCVFLFVDKNVKQSAYLGSITYGLVLIVGVFVIGVHTHRNHMSHYSNRNDLTSKVSIKVHVFKQLKSTKFHKKYLGKVLSVGSIQATGLVLVSTDSTQNIEIDDVFYASVKLTELPRALNPHQFDYNAYMQQRQVYHQVHLNNKNTIVFAQKQSLYGIASTIRKQINESLKTHMISEENLSIVNALLLGQRYEVSRDTYESFTGSGAVHILAISGLHIGLLLLLLSVVFKPLTYFNNGKLIVSIVIIVLLWTYAFIVGMSASVVRAVTMFSLFTIAMYSNRLTNTYNTLAISAFILLLFNPFYVFDIGFQMSYAAVFAIIWIKPVFDNFYQPSYFISRKFWDVFSVTISAQLGVLPISLFYFHQFPGLFFVSNLIIIPLLGILLGIGVLTLIFAYCGWVPKVLFLVFNQCISWLLDFVQFIATQEEFVIKELSFNDLNMIAFYTLIITVVLLLKRFNYQRLVSVFCSIIFVQLVFLNNAREATSKEFIVFNQYKATLIGEKYARNFHYASKNLTYTQSLKTYVVNEFIQSIERDSMKNIYILKDKHILVVDNKEVYNTSFKPNIVVLTVSPKVNLERLISIVNPELIVVDNNNYKSYVNRWKETCLATRIPIHITKEKGAYILK
jgi:competence protein ComEC